MGSSLRIVSFIAQYSSSVQQDSIDRSTRAHRACKAGHSASGALWSDVPGGLVFDPLPDLDRHRVLALFQDVPHQPDGTRQDADAAHDLPRQPEFATDGADGAGRVDRQHLAGGTFSLGADQLFEPDVVAGKAVVLGDLEQARGARVNRLVQRMTES